MPRRNARLLVVAGGIRRKFEDFDRQVFENGRQVDRAAAPTRSPKRHHGKTTEATNWELQTYSGRTGLRMGPLAISCCLCRYFPHTLLSWDERNEVAPIRLFGFAARIPRQ
jgi:hypothetical protein